MRKSRVCSCGTNFGGSEIGGRQFATIVDQIVLLMKSVLLEWPPVTKYKIKGYDYVLECAKCKSVAPPQMVACVDCGTQYCSIDCQMLKWELGSDLSQFLKFGFTGIHMIMPVAYFYTCHEITSL